MNDIVGCRAIFRRGNVDYFTTRPCQYDGRKCKIRELSKFGGNVEESIYKIVFDNFHIMWAYGKQLELVLEQKDES
jgi:hypothetical protein